MLNMYLKVLWILVSLVFVFHRVKSTCPAYDAIKPCTCSSLIDKQGDEFSIITCNDLQSESALESIITAAKGIKVFEFRLEDSTLKYLPSDAFIGTTFEVISLANSSIASLSDSDVAFKGLETKLHLIEIFNCSFVDRWEWRQLSHLKHIMEIFIGDSDLADITDGISNLQHLDIEGFVFQKNNIQWLDNEAFSPFTYLKRLMLDNNSIGSLKRSMFPRPAKLLKIIGLSYNNLKSLPEDMFLDMPALASLYLTGNPLRTIDEVVFKPVWYQLRLFLFYGTFLSCDCRLSWLTKVDNTQKYIHAECHGPSLFKGRLLTSLQTNELWCQH